METAFGVVLFDEVVQNRKSGKNNEQRVLTEGWAAIEGDAAVRFQRVTELPNDVHWLTNLSFGDFWRSQLAAHPNFYPSSFLRTDFPAVCDDVGVGLEYTQPEQTATLMAIYFGRVMWLAKSIGVDPATSREKALAKMISERTVNKYKLPDALNAALETAYQTQTKVITKRQGKGHQAITLRRPRYEHALEMLHSPVPSEYNWEYLNHERLPAPDKAVDWCLANELPVLANVVVKPDRGVMSDVLSYGSGAGVARSWISQPELLFVSQYAQVDVIGAFVCADGYQAQPELEKIPELGAFSHSSYALGLFMENFFISMASPRVMGQQATYYAPRSIWYRAYDRFQMFLKAMALTAEKFPVSGYGVGSVWLSYPPGATEDLFELAGTLNLDISCGAWQRFRTERRLGQDE